MEIAWITVSYFFIGTLLGMFVNPWARRFLDAKSWEAARYPLIFVCLFLWPMVFMLLFTNLIRYKKGVQNDTQSKNP